MGEVLLFPERPPDCRDCVNAALGAGTFCLLFAEEIVTEETTAAECEWFERE